MSQTSAAGSGGSAAPGWYTDPHDPNGLRWWSGEGWTEHVSAGSSAAGSSAAGSSADAAGAQAAASVDSQTPLPSRRALRDPATEASEAAEAALRAQAALQQAAAQEQAQQQAQAAQAAQQQAAQEQAQQQAAQAQAQAAQQQAAQHAAVAAQQQAAAAAALPPLQPVVPPPAQQQSPPVPTLPVAPTSFLEQQGYAPVGSTPAGAPADPNAWNQPADTTQSQGAQPQGQQPQGQQPQAAAQPVQPAQPNAWNQPLQTTQPAAPAQANAWNQPEQPTQPGWGAPTEPSNDLESLFAAPTPEAGNSDSQPGQWGLSPTSSDASAGRNTDAEVNGSSTFWGWLVAISPILAAGAVIYVLLSTSSTLTDWPFLAAIAAPYLLVVLFAVADRAVLIQLGHSQPRSPAWALLSAPIYLIVRAGETRAEDGSGTALTLVWFVSVLVAIGGIVGYGFLTGHALIAGLPT